MKIIFVNQFGFSRRECGERMPENMEFMDIRKGSDVEFGQSIYEPFGIAQLEPLTFGGICVFSSVCGCLGFLRDTTGGADVRNAIIADYTNLTAQGYSEIEDILQIERSVRDRTEAVESQRVAMQICSHLPKNEAEVESMIQSGYELAKEMNWDKVVKEYLLRGLQSVSKATKEIKVPDELHIS